MMKAQPIFRQITCFVCLLLAGSMYAQHVSTEYADRVNYIFAKIDKNRVPNGILIDQSIEFTEVSRYSGQSMTNSNFVDNHTLRDIYYTLASGRMVSNDDMVSPQELSTRFTHAREPRTITLTGLYMKYAQYKTNAYSSGLIHIENDQIYDVYQNPSPPSPPRPRPPIIDPCLEKIRNTNYAIRREQPCLTPASIDANSAWLNPYNEKEVFAIAPSVPRYKGKAIYVRLPNNLWFTNQENIHQLQIDFNDGKGYQTVNLGETKQVLYSTIGIKEWKYKLQLSNGQIKYSHSQINIEEAPIGILDRFEDVSVHRVVGACPRVSPIDGRAFCEIEAEQAYLGELGRAFVTIDYIDTSNQQITRPLIVVEGLDMGHILEPEALFGSSGISRFIRQIERQDGELEVILDDNQQYDIVYVDWQNGTDFLERNAYTLEAVIEWVNEQKVVSGSTEPNVVLGQSMGGVIARYALRDMENKQLDHDTRLYISHDAPHQGAYIPLAGQ